MKSLFVVFIFCATWVAGAAAETPPQATSAAEKAALTATVDGKSGYDSGMGVLATPGQQISVTLSPLLGLATASVAEAGARAQASIAEQYEWSVDRGALRDVTGNALVFECPKEPGTCVLTGRMTRGVTIKSAGSKDVTVIKETTWTLHVLTQYPYDREGKGTIEGYPVGIYPNESGPRAVDTVRSNADLYRPPQWFVRVTRSERSIRISPHFTIGEFCSSLSDEDVTFVAISPRLVDRLERIHAKLVTPDRPHPRVAILRAFISPNEADQLRRKGLAMTEFSRHIYGDAAAIIVDTDGNGVMDDLNGDGKGDFGDVDVLSRVVEQVERESGVYGGMGLHGGPTDALMPKTPYLSIDCRGRKARWSSGAKNAE